METLGITLSQLASEVTITTSEVYEAARIRDIQDSAGRVGDRLSLTDTRQSDAIKTITVTSGTLYRRIIPYKDNAVCSKIRLNSVYNNDNHSRQTPQQLEQMQRLSTWRSARMTLYGPIVLSSSPCVDPV